jgi:REP element-mobilizing transposase RayT
LAVFARVFYELKSRFAFEIRGLHLEDDWLKFYIKPEDGEELPAIMKWLKQTFAQRYNRKEGRIGHIWGDRYGARIVEGEAPEDIPEGGAAEGKWRVVRNIRVRPHHGKPAVKPAFFLNFPFSPAPG